MLAVCAFHWLSPKNTFLVEMSNNVTPEIQSAEEYQKKLDDNVNAVLSLLNGMNTEQAKTILEAAIYRLPTHSCVQFEKQPQE